MKNYSIPENLLQGIYQYLINKPMIEVENLISGIRNCTPITENKGEKNDNTII